MAKKIRLLDENTINKIAAGEVIENSASVVKELVQNSFDADATELFIETKEAGRALIRVVDNGSGMAQDDALLSIERHTTSKLTLFDDLATLHSMGFRGEALASIAAISRFSLFTSERETGHFIRVEGGKLAFCNPIPMERGTKIEIEQLFYNVPVRRRFLSSPEKEERELLKMIELLALSRPDIKLTFIQNGKREVAVHPEPFSERIISIFGHAMKKELIALHFEEDKKRVEGLISSPLFHRGTKSHHFLFINNRPVTSHLINHAVRDAYSTLLPQSRFPLFFLRLTLDPSEIDVNVHPQKKEIRFYREQEIRASILKAVFTTLSTHSTPLPVEWALSQRNSSTPASSFPQEKEPEPDWKWIEKSSFDQPTCVRAPTYRLIGTLSGYILCEKERGVLLLVDQKKAHSRVLFEKWEEASLPPTLFTMPLVVPYTFQFDQEEVKKLRSHLPDLVQSGFEIRPFGPTSFIVESHPTGLSQQDCEEVLRTLVEREESFLPSTEQKSKERARKARLFSISATALLSKEEAEALLKDLFSCKQPDLSPEGKPTFRQIAIEEFMNV